MTESPLLASLAAAVDARPGDLALRLHLAQLLLDADRSADAVPHLAVALQQQPTDPQAQALMRRAIGGTPAPPSDPAPSPPTETHAAEPDPAAAAEPDWSAYEDELSEVIPPRFTRSDDEPDPISGNGDDVVDVEVCASPTWAV